MNTIPKPEHKNKNNEARTLLSSKQQVIICPITGLSITLNIPAISGKYLEYKNPLASGKVASQYAALSFQELRTLPAEILSALILTTLNDKNLLVTKLPAFQLRTELEELGIYSLVNSFRFLSHFKPNKAIPQLSISAVEEARANYSAYIKTLEQLASLTYYAENPEAINPNIPMAHVMAVRKPAKLSTKQLDTFKAALKTHYKTLQSSPEISSTLLQLLKLLTQNEALKTISMEVRNKVINALRVHKTNEAAQAFANILERSALPTAQELSLGEEAIDQPKAAKKSLADILAAKTRTKQQAEQVWEQELKATEYEVSTTPETDEDFDEEVEASKDDEEDEWERKLRLEAYEDCGSECSILTNEESCDEF